jgi:outer membrane autotransporter protein
VLDIGASSAGTLTVEGGGTVTSAYGQIGVYSGANGMVTVTGAGSTWINSGYLTVGNTGDGTLTVADGAIVSNVIGRVGLSAGSTGTVMVTGDGSTWTNSDGLNVGYGGDGTLNIEAGAEVISTYGQIGLLDSSTGTATVTGAGSTWTNSDTVIVGVSGDGTLNIEDGGAVRNVDGFIGDSVGSTGAATVTGAGSTWSSSGNLTVGHYGAGTLTIADGGAVSAAAVTIADTMIGAGTLNTGALNIGAAAGDAAVGAGTLDTAEVAFAAGSGTLNFNHTDADYRFAPVISGAGTINQIAGTTRLVANSSGFTGSTSVSGGVLLVDGSLGIGGSTVGVTDGGGLGGSGTIGGAVTVADGRLIGVQSRTLTMNSLTLGGDSTVDVALGAPGHTGLFNVTGDLTLDGTLNVTDAGGFGAGVYRLVDYGGDLTDLGLEVGATPVGVTAADLAIQTAIDKEVNLVSSAGVDLLFWDGGATGLHNNDSIDGGAGIWDAAAANWTDRDGDLNGVMKPMPGFAVFQGTAGTVTVDDSAGSISAAGMQFAADGYVVEGDAIELAGAAGESIIRVGNGGALGAGYTATIASTLTGAGSLVKTDLGTLVLTGTGSALGANLAVTDGALVLDGGSLTLGAGARVVGGGTMRLQNGADLVTQGPILGVAVGSTMTVDGVGTTVTSEGLTRISSLTGPSSGRARLAITGGAVFDSRHSAQIGQPGDDGASVAVAGAGSTWKVSDSLAIGDGGATGELLVANGGRVESTGATTIGSDGTLRIGDGGTAGTITAAAITNNGQITADFTDFFSLGPAVSGSGTLTKLGSGELELTGVSSYTGVTSVNGGLLSVNGDISSSSNLTIGRDGMVGGVGLLPTTTVSGTIAPGNSIGTLNVAGDITFAAGSRYEVEVDPPGADSDLIHATGEAFLNGGSVVHIGLGGVYDPSSTYTILTADAGLTGTFAGVTSDFAFLDPILGYGANDVTLTLERNEVTFCSVGRTRNQCATGEGVESLTAGNELYDAVVGLDAVTARSAFDQLSGEIHASLKSGLIEDSRHIRNAATNRIRAAFEGVGASADPVRAYGPGGPYAAPAATDDLAAWGQVFGSWGDTEGDGNAARLDRSTGGLVMGIDALVAEQWRLGVMAGYSRSSFDVDDRSSSATSDNFHLGLYGGTNWNLSGGTLGLRAGAAYTWHDIDTMRRVGFAGFADKLEAGYDAGTAQVFGELGYTIDVGAIALEPFAGLAYVNLDADGFTEKGEEAALTGDGGSTDATFSTLGVRVASEFVISGMTSTARGMLGWRHAFGGLTPTSSLAFAGGEAFSTAGVPVAEDAAVIEVGLDLNLTDTATFGLSYGGQFGDGAEDHAFKANLGVRF